jgi:uncharacterized protein (TIGR00725 family)
MSALVPPPRYVAVVGGTDCTDDVLALAEEVGRLLAQRGAILVTGGREGVAQAASRGAALAGGTTVGILPSRSRAEANPYVTIAIPTGLGETRNALVVMDADAVIALPGVYGTLTEIGFALLAETRVIMLGGWELARDGRADTNAIRAESAREAVDLALG